MKKETKLVGRSEEFESNIRKSNVKQKLEEWIQMLPIKNQEKEIIYTELQHIDIIEMAYTYNILQVERDNSIFCTSPDSKVYTIYENYIEMLFIRVKRYLLHKLKQYCNAFQ